MRNLTVMFFLLSAGTCYSQIRAFDNSKAILPWIYNPSADFVKDFQLYMGYDGRGNNSALSQSYIAGFRTPLLRENQRPGSASMMGVQMLKISQDLLKHSTINANFAHQITLTEKITLAFGLGAGFINIKYNYDDLVYLDQHDPLLNNGEDFFNVHLNAGFSMVMDEKLFVNLAAPYLIKDQQANVKELILRAGYILELHSNINLIAAAHLDTFNNNMIVGGDLRAGWKETVSILGGADQYKYYSGILLKAGTFSFGYIYGQNFRDVLDQMPSHQLSLFGNISFLRQE